MRASIRNACRRFVGVTVLAGLAATASASAASAVPARFVTYIAACKVPSGPNKGFADRVTAKWQLNHAGNKVRLSTVVFSRHASRGSHQISVNHVLIRVPGGKSWSSSIRPGTGSATVITPNSPWAEFADVLREMPGNTINATAKISLGFTSHSTCTIMAAVGG